MIYGQTFLLQCSALRRFLVTDGQNTYDQIKRGRRSKCAWSNCVLSGSPNKYWPQTCDACKIEVNIRQQFSFSFSFSELWYTPLEFNSGKIYHHLPNWTRWNKHDKVWTSVNILFKWRFCIRRHRCCLSSLMSILRKFKYRSIYISIYQHHNGQTIHTVKLKEIIGIAALRPLLILTFSN